MTESRDPRLGHSDSTYLASPPHILEFKGLQNPDTEAFSSDSNNRLQLSMGAKQVAPLYAPSTSELNIDEKQARCAGHGL
jgi:hypothetical protein